MRKVTLISNPSIPAGTFGTMLLDDHTCFSTGELPWHDNDAGKSCIPAGTFIARWFDSPKHGWCYQVYGIPDRSMIEIHSANFMGDKDEGLECQLLGCIALGKSVGMLETHPGGPYQMAVLRSKQAIQEFEDNMKQEDFELTVIRG